MRKIAYLLIGVIVLITTSLKAQESSKIETKQKFGVIFYQNGVKLTPKQLVEITKSNPEAYSEMKIAKSNLVISNITAYAGGFIVGWQLGNVLTGKEVQMTNLAIGGGLVGISFLLSNSYSKHAKSAVQIYNSGLTSSNLNKVNIRFGLTESGIGLCMNF